MTRDTSGFKPIDFVDVGYRVGQIISGHLESQFNRKTSF